MIVATALNAGQDKLKVIHSSSSQKNPLTWGMVQQYLNTYYKISPYEKRIGKPFIYMINNPYAFEVLRLTPLNFRLLTRSRT